MEQFFERLDTMSAERRHYTLEGLTQHLYQAQDWTRLFRLLEQPAYRLAKVQLDPSMALYGQDLDLGRKAASWDGWTMEEKIVHLPHLWRYTLLRCSLASRADKYPREAFSILVLLKREQEAMNLAELVTDPTFKIQALLEIAQQIGMQSNREQESIQILLRASEEAITINKKNFLETDPTLSELVTALVRIQQWDQAESVINRIEEFSYKASLLGELSEALVQTQQLERARRIWAEIERLINMNQSIWYKVTGWGELGKALTQAQQWNEAERVWDEAERAISMLPESDRVYALRILGIALAQAQQWARAEHVISKMGSPMYVFYEYAKKLLAHHKAPALRELGKALAQAHQQERAEQVWNEAEQLTNMLKDQSRDQSEYIYALEELGKALAQAHQQERAERVWDNVERVVSRKNASDKVPSLTSLAKALIQSQQWERAERVISMMENFWQKAAALSALGKAHAQDQHWEDAERVWAENERTINLKENHWNRNFALDDQIRALIRAQQWERAEYVIGMLEDKAGKHYALREMGKALVQAQQWERAEHIWQETERVNSALNGSLSGALADALVEAHQWGRAERVISKMKDNPGPFYNVSSEKASVLCNLAKGLTHVQRWEDAERIWDEAERVIRTTHFWKYSPTLREMAEALVQAQQWKRAERVIGMIEHVSNKAIALCILAKALIQAQRWEDAEHALSDAERLITMLNSRDKPQALCELSTALVQVQQWERAERIWSDVEKIISDEIVDKTFMLRTLANALAQAQRWEHAERVIGMIDDISEKALALSRFAEALAYIRDYEYLLRLLQREWLQVSTRAQAIALLPLARELVSLKPENNTAFHEAFTWVDNFLNTGM